MEALKLIKDVLVRPTYFFTHLRERGIMVAFMYLSFLAFFTSFLKEASSIWSASVTQRLASALFGRALEEYQLLLGPFLTNILLSYIAILATSFIWALILHGWIKLFSGKADYKKTYQLSVYSRIPEFLFGWIPVIGVLSSVYSLIILIKGTNILHRIHKKRATFMFLIPYLVIFLLFAATISFLFFATTTKLLG